MLARVNCRTLSHGRLDSTRLTLISATMSRHAAKRPNDLYFEKTQTCNYTLGLQSALLTVLLHK